MAGPGPRTFIAPPALQPGATVAIVAPSSPFKHEPFRTSVALLRKRYDVRMRDDVYATRGYLAGTDERRIEELHAALSDPSVHAIIAARGGDGATRLLDRLDTASLRQHPKPIVGYSDITALHSVWGLAGVRSIHACNTMELHKLPIGCYERWIAALEGATPDALTGLRAIRGGRARGPLIGGNLALLAALVGTPYAPPIDGAVLFMEDVNEQPYRVDRMLNTLRLAGWFERVAAVVCGAFTESEVGEDGVTVEQVLDEALARPGIPAVRGVPAGHVADNFELPLGAPVELDADAGTLRFLEPAVAA